TTAKTLAWSLDIPIYEVSSLANLANNAASAPAYICPFFDARRERVYTGLYKSENGIIVSKKADCNISMETWLVELVELESQITFISPHAKLFQKMIEEYLGERAFILSGLEQYPNASYLLTA